MKSRFVKIFPFYYGWIILAVGSIGVICSIPGQTMGVSVFTDHLISHLELSRNEISIAYLLGTLTSALLMTKAGKFYDRFGVRITASLATLFLGLNLFFMSKSVVINSYVRELFQWEGSRFAFLLMVIGFFGIRFCGQGVLTLVSRSMVMRWFENHRGFAAALLGITTSFGFSYAPRVLQYLIDMSQWDGAWFSLGLILILFIIPFILLFFRDSPERCGLEMEEGLKQKDVKTVSDRGENLSLKEARGDRQFWFYIAVVFFWAMYNTAFTFHITDIYMSFGQGKDDAVSIFLPIAIISVISRFGGSWLTDFLKMKHIFYSIVVTMLLSSVALSLPFSQETEVLLIIGMGLSSGLFGVITSVTWVKLYGREHLGAISGFAMSFIVAGSALGPYLFSLMESLWGHYKFSGVLGVVWVAIIGLSSLGTVLRSDS